MFLYELINIWLFSANSAKVSEEYYLIGDAVYHESLLTDLCDFEENLSAAQLCILYNGAFTKYYLFLKS